MLFKITPAILLAMQAASVKAAGHMSSRKCMENEALDCALEGPEWAIMASVPGADKIFQGIRTYCETGNTIGSNTGLLPEAADAAISGAPVVDGMSGDTDFPFMDMKTLLSAGERSVCPESYGYKLTGVPDGMGAMLLDDDTVRVMYQSESYGPLRFESFPAPMNEGTFTMGGSRVQYVDYDRAMMADYMSGDFAASEMVVGVGTMIEKVVNLKGEMVGPRNRDGPTESGVHYGNADAEGNYVVVNPPMEADWFYQSFCSAHLEEQHQWGEGIGLEDDVYFTNEEWNTYQDGMNFVGIGFHALDIATKTAYALGSTGHGGYEKLSEINPQHPDYTILALSGYNGNFGGYSAALEARNAEYTRDDGMNYTWTNNIHPARIYVGIKGKMEDGSDAPADDFLARNGLRHGAMYGYAVDMKPDRQAKGFWRDEFHRNVTAINGASVKGAWIKIPWMWDGTVTNYEHSDAWVYQDKPPHTNAGSGRKDFEWWTAAGPDAGGCKTEHLSSDPREGFTGFVQSSTCGYFGHYYVEDVMETLDAANGGLPNVFDGEYKLYQGETDVTAQINLGGKGQYANTTVDATYNWDVATNPPKATFEDIDGLEVIEGPEGKLYVIIQEDSGNDYGERMLMAPLEHDRDGQPLPFYFLAMSGGSENTRIKNGVSVPAGTWSRATSHEFSGVFDLSGLLLRDESGAFVVGASETGAAKRAADRMVDINDKQIMVNLQAHSQNSGLIEAFQLDRGGQIYMIQPKNIE